MSLGGVHVQKVGWEEREGEENQEETKGQREILFLEVSTTV
jgi:hypothetical protein